MTDHPQTLTPVPLRLIPRRRFVQGSAVLAGGVSAALVASPDALASPNLHRHWSRWLARQGDGTPVSVDDYVPVALSEAELSTLTAAIDRLIPPDDIGPGAAEAGVAIYIDRLLAGSGVPFLPIYQGGLAALDATDGGGFAAMSVDDQDALLTSVEAGDVADAPAGFFPLMLEHTRQGMFGDPIHGGNREFAGWDLIRYPASSWSGAKTTRRSGPTSRPSTRRSKRMGGGRDGQRDSHAGDERDAKDRCRHRRAGGGRWVAAYVLTKAGLKVVGIEAGPRLTNADFLDKYDELDGYGFANRLGDVKANKEVPTWRRTPDADVEQPAFAIKMMNAVGGTSIHYTANHYRFRQDDFRIRSSTIEAYGEDALPEGSAVADWPFDYEDLEPYYEQAEVLIGISGQGGSNPFESPRANDYPMPPLPRSGYTALAHDAAEALGYHPFPLPAAITSVDYNGRPACTLCGYCTGFGCWNDAKSSTLVSAIPEAEATGNLEIRTDSRVMRILTDDQGRATGVEYRDGNGDMHVQPAGIVIVATYTYENVRLLLLSTSEQFPDGLANSSGQVGRYYMAHSYPGATGVFPGMVLNQMSGTGSQATSIDDFNGDNFDHTGLGFIRGGVMAAGMAEASPIGTSRSVPPGMPTWGAEYKRWLHDNALSIGGIGVQLEVLPYEDNYMDLDPEVTDEDGVPVIG